MLDVRNQLVFFLMCCLGFCRQIKIDHPTSASKHTEAERPMWTRGCLGAAGDMVESRQKAYKMLAMMSGALTGPFLFDWQRGQGFQSVPASHLHLLIKCHNNMIFNNQQASAGPPRRERER